MSYLDSCNTEKNKEIYEKVKSTNKERYGKEFLQQCDDIRLKKDNTSLLRYGHKTSLMNDDVKEKIKKILIKKKKMLLNSLASSPDPRLAVDLSILFLLYGDIRNSAKYLVYARQVKERIQMAT